MRGMYVDQNSCMVLVLLTGGDDEHSQYTVHGTTTLNEEWSAPCHLSSSKVVLVNKDKESVGFRNDDGAIVWDEGNTWCPIHMSSTQFAFLTRRPYVPMTYVVYMVMSKLFSRAKALTKTA